MNWKAQKSLLKLYFIEFSTANPEQFSYVLGFQKFGNNLNYTPRNSKTIKRIITNIFKAYQTLQGELVYHGNLNFDSIFVDESLSVRFYNFILGGCVNEFEYDAVDIDRQKRLFHFADLLYCSPEVKLSIACFKENTTGFEFDPVKSDLFSLGLVTLRLFTDFKGLNDLQLDSQIACLINLKSGDEIEQTFLRNNEYSVMILGAIDQLKKRIREVVDFIPSKTIKYILLSLLQVCYGRRYLSFDQTEIKAVAAQKRRSKISWFEEKQEDRSDEKSIKAILSKLCVLFRKTSRTSYKIAESLKSLHAEFLELYQRFQKDIWALISIYEDQPCRSEISMTYGITEAVLSIFAKLQDEFQFKLFLEQSQGHQPGYQNHFAYFMTQTDEIAKDFIITSFTHSKFQTDADLKFMFDTSTYLDLSYTSLSQFPDICHNFESLLKCSFISSVITECSQTNCDLIGAFHTILPFCYLFITIPRMCGVLSMNLRIFIRDYFRIQSYKKKFHGTWPLETTKLKQRC